MELKISIPEGHEIDINKSSFERIVFKKIEPKSITERIKTLSDAIDKLDDNDEDVLAYRTLISLTYSDPIKRLLKIQSCIIIAKALNEGWTPDWSNSKEYKYYPWFKGDSSGSGFSFYDFADVRSYSGVGSRLCFKSKELAEYAGKQFTEYYKGWML